METFFDFTSILIFISIALASYYFMDCIKKRSNIPGPLRLPYLGNLLTILRQRQGSPIKFLSYLHARYGEICRLFFGDQMIIFISSKDLVYDAFVKQKENFSTRPSWLISNFDIQRTKGIVWSNGDVSKLQRRLVLQYFREFGLGKNSLENKILQEMEELSSVFASYKGQATNVEADVSKTIMNVIHSMVFGHRLDFKEEKMLNLQKHLSVIFKLPGFLDPGNYFLFLRLLANSAMEKRMESFHEIGKYVFEEANIHRESFDKNNIRDFVDVYIETELEPDGKMLTKDNLITMIIDIFAAGSDTTAATLMWLFMAMIKHPDVQAKCFSEISNNVGTSRQVRLSDKINLKYIEATIMETQRLSNVALGSLPHTALTDTSLNGYTVPKDSIVVALIKPIHSDATEWDSPMEFNPSRFLDDDNNIRKFPAFMPFSVGPRSCPGENLARTEAFLIFANIIQKFKLERADDKPLSFEGITGVTTVPAPFELKFHLRS